MSTLCLQLVDIKTILDEINIHKPESKKAPNLTLCFKKLLKKMVGVTGIEPVTPSMSTKCSPAELHPHTISLWPANRCWHRINRRAICAVTLATGYICTNRPVISSLFSANAGQISQNLPSNCGKGQGGAKLGYCRHHNRKLNYDYEHRNRAKVRCPYCG